MATNVTWPSSTKQPYEIILTSDTSDAPKKVAEGSEEFDRFKDLTRDLVNRPKGELAVRKDD